MSERDALLAAVIASPDDDTPRLVMADWLDDHGEPERAEFIRVQCELARLAQKHYHECTGTITRDMETSALRRREQELLRMDYPPLLGVRSRVRNGRERHNPYGWIGAAGYAMDWCDFRRGFVESVEAPWEAWRDHAEALLAAHPVTAVTLTTAPEVARGRRGSASLRGDGRWFTSGEMVRELSRVFDGSVPFSWGADQDDRILLRLRWPTVRKWAVPGATTRGTPVPLTDDQLALLRNVRG